MRNTKFKAAVISAGFLLTLSSSVYANTLIVNANGYTLDRSNKLKQFAAMVFDNQGKVVVVGDEKKLRKQYSTAKIIDLQGKTVLPGLIDAHGHVFELGVAASQLSLRASANLAQAQKEIAAYAQKYPQHQWILGGEWNQAIWKLGRFPTAAEIDVVLKDRPVWLRRRWTRWLGQLSCDEACWYRA